MVDTSRWTWKQGTDNRQWYLLDTAGQARGYLLYHDAARIYEVHAYELAYETISGGLTYLEEAKRVLENHWKAQPGN